MLIYIIAGEPSGDLLGGRLMAGLRAHGGNDIRFAGIGGETMRAAGLDSLFPMAELTVMGLVEVLPRIPRILKRVKETVADIVARRPDALVTIDSWGFTGRVQKAIQAQAPGIPRIHYVAPMVWAWKPNRSKKLAKVLDLLMTLLPFEPPWFTKDGLRAVHVGHPVIETGAGDGAAFRARHGIAADVPLLVMLPGSRQSETGRLLPVFAETLELLADRYPRLKVVVPTVETVAAKVKMAVKSWPLPAKVVEGQVEKHDAFAAGTVALAASGTVALELAMAGLPTVITYRTAPLSYYIATRFLGLGQGVKYATLVNIIMDRPVMPELLQDDCRPERLAAAVGKLFDDAGAREAQRADSHQAMLHLGLGSDSPSARAAEAVLGLIAERTKR
ncbi:MAG: lipid-A-disaccharide synthase [Magnetospirillum sp.]|nr:lipid-A-disaccharide synthase [Magnetospirillum sp.]